MQKTLFLLLIVQSTAIFGADTRALVSYKTGFHDLPTELILEIIKKAHKPEKLFAFMGLISKDKKWSEPDLFDGFMKYMTKKRPKRGIAIAMRIASPAMKNYVTRHINTDEFSSLLKYKKKLTNYDFGLSGVDYSPRVNMRDISSREDRKRSKIKAKKLLFLSQVCGEDIYKNEVSRAVINFDSSYLIELSLLKMHEYPLYVSTFGSPQSYLSKLLDAVVCVFKSQRKLPSSDSKKTNRRKFSLCDCYDIMNSLSYMGAVYSEKHQKYVIKHQDFLMDLRDQCFGRVLLRDS